MNKNRIFIGIIITFLLISPYSNVKAAGIPATPANGVSSAQWNTTGDFEVSAKTVDAFDSPEAKKSAFTLYKGMRIQGQMMVDNNGAEWLQAKFGSKNYVIPASETEGNSTVAAISTVTSVSTALQDAGIIDEYGILDQPHQFAIKLVKEKGAKGRLETYEKTDNGYVFRNSYQVHYRKEGPKSIYGDLKSPGGPVIRYVYRTTNTSRGGINSAGQSFGGYKVSYPMPHDALPYLQAGIMSPQEYNKIPAINEKDGVFSPQPHSRLGADIVIHTDIWGSLGCITMKNEDMSNLYLKDLVTKNDKELIPLIIYDENVQAPAEGQLFTATPAHTS